MRPLGAIILGSYIDELGQRQGLLGSTWLVTITDDKAAPGYWMSFAAVCGLIATLILYRRNGTVLIPERSVPAA